METILGKKALLIQKRYMRRILRKPKDMSIRIYCARFSELNKYLKSFPPFQGSTQYLPADKVLEHLEFAVPNSWQKQMVLHRFNALENSQIEFVEFCERIESSEEIYDSTHLSQKTNTKTGDNNTGSKVSAGRPFSKRKLDKYCMYHSNNSAHVTDECKVLEAQEERMTAQLRRVGAGKYSEKTKFEKKKSLQSFKQEIVKSVVKSLKECGPARSHKRRKVMQMEEFNMDQFCDLKVSDTEVRMRVLMTLTMTLMTPEITVKVQKWNMSAFL